MEFSVEEQKENISLKNQIRNAQNELNQMNSVAEIELEKRPRLSEKYRQTLKKNIVDRIGGKNIKRLFTDVIMK